MAGVKDDKVVEAHGTFYTSHCLKCCKEYTLEWMKGMYYVDIVLCVILVHMKDIIYYCSLLFIVLV